MCNIIVYLAVDKDGEESIHTGVPVRKAEQYWDSYGNEDFIYMPRGTIKKLTGKDITWENDYIEYVGDNYDPTIE